MNSPRYSAHESIYFPVRDPFASWKLLKKKLCICNLLLLGKDEKQLMNAKRIKDLNSIIGEKRRVGFSGFEQETFSNPF